VYVALRLVDYVLPSGRHFKWFERWSNTDKPTPPAKPEDEKG
jgi:hypothetical protein